MSAFDPLRSLGCSSKLLVGQCVVVSGYLSGSALFLSKADSRMRYAHWSDELKLRRLGVYGIEKASPETPPEPGPYEIVGTVGECERLGDGTIMVMGYCHSANGPCLAISELRRTR